MSGRPAISTARSRRRCRRGSAASGPASGTPPPAPARRDGPRRARTGRAASRAAGASPAACGSPAGTSGPSVILRCIPTARSTGGWSFHAYRAPSPNCARTEASSAGSSESRATSYSSLYAMSLYSPVAIASARRGSASTVPRDRPRRTAARSPRPGRRRARAPGRRPGAPARCPPGHRSTRRSRPPPPRRARRGPGPPCRGRCPSPRRRRPRTPSGPRRPGDPRRNAWRFFSTAAPLSVNASSIADAGSGSAPVWKAAPSSSVSANWSSPNSASAERAGVDDHAGVRPGPLGDALQHRVGVGERDRRVDDHRPGRHLRRRDRRDRAPRRGRGEVRGLGGDEQVGAEVEVALAVGRPARGLEPRPADLDVGDDRAALLREAGLVEPAHVAPGDEPGGREDLGHRRHARCRRCRRAAR